MTDELAAVELACEGHKVSASIKKKIPDICFLFYRDRACQAEIMRRVKTSPQTIERITHSGIGRRYEELLNGDALPAEHKPNVGSHRSTRGRW